MRVDKLVLNSPYMRHSHFSTDLTKWLWLDNNTFIIPMMMGFDNILKLVYVTLFEDNTFSISVRCIDHLKKMVIRESRGPGYHNYFGNFFTIPFSDNYFYFVTHCSAPHRHSRLLLVCKKDLKIVRYLELPGNVVDIAVDARNQEFFISLCINALAEYEQEISVRSPPPNYQSFKRLDCMFGATWTSKEHSPHMRKNTIFKISACGRKWDTSECHIFYVFLAPGLDNTLNEALRVIHFMNATAYGGKLSLTNDFVIAHDEKIIGNKLISRHHHFHYNNSLENRIVKVSRAFYHPTKPFFVIDLCDAKSFQVHLCEWADSETRQKFSPMPYEFQYNQHVVDMEQREDDPKSDTTDSD